MLADVSDQFLNIVAEPLVRAALAEDLGRGGDVTTEAIVPAAARASAIVAARHAGVVAGGSIALLAFRILDPSMRCTIDVADGERISAGGTIATIEGSARVILSGERVALNVLGHLCGIATATRSMVDAVAPSRVRVADTRKTTPGLRALEKYAVRCGGGINHRFGLDDAVLIKDNHLALAGSIREAVAAVRARVGHMMKVEVEVDSLDQLREALETPVDAVLLDNMSPETLTRAVDLVKGRVLTEASGGVTLENIASIARSGVDIISTGWLTRSAPALDVGLDVDIAP
ncbi:MAG TPA: carboxylating nicotinate-nucleotide diphosphorylase [Candidatus Tumulicola sp.]|jgi:nicotinate-nucleotide pyrophosphorylase (carboxylating)